MKKIHILPTDKPSRLYESLLTNKLFILENSLMDVSKCNREYQKIYITSDEEIKEGVNQWYLDKFLNKPRNSSGSQYGEKQNVIILTTDINLIVDGIQAIDDEFLEWFVKNPSCEEVEILRCPIEGLYTIIPKEEPKQETFYSEEDMKCFADWCRNGLLNTEYSVDRLNEHLEQWNQFKKK